MGHVRPGIVCGLRSEARALGLPAAIPLRVAGARPEAAEAAARDLAARGVHALLSVGLAGGLDPALAAGALIVPEVVVDQSGACHPSSAVLATAFGLPLTRHRLLGVDSPVTDPKVKRALGARFGAHAVDTESHRVAAVAHAAGLPFLAVRAIADPVRHRLPLSALSAIRPDGTVDVKATWARLLARPQDLPALLGLGWDSARAHATLRRVGARLARALGPD